MISMLVPLHIGNAMKLLLEPPAGSVSWLIERALGTDPDTTPVVVYQGSERYVVDMHDLVNGQTYTWTVRYFDGLSWLLSDSATGSPAAAYVDKSTDVLTVVRDRIDFGLQNEIARGELSPADGVIDVLNAP